MPKKNTPPTDTDIPLVPVSGIAADPDTDDTATEDTGTEAFTGLGGVSSYGTASEALADDSDSTSSVIGSDVGGDLTDTADATPTTTIVDESVAAPAASSTAAAVDYGAGASTSGGFAARTPHGLAPARPPHFHYSLVSWGSVFAGAAIAVVTGAMLNLLGVGIGVSALEPGDPSGASAGGLSLAAGLWLAISTVVGLVVGGYVAARASANPDHHEGMLHGAAVWAVSFLLALFLTGSLVSGTAFNAMQAAGAAAESARAPTVASAARDALGAARDDTPTDTAQERRVEEGADRAADGAAGAAFWAFATMLAGLIGAVIGGGLGSRADHGHRPRREYGEVI